MNVSTKCARSEAAPGNPQRLAAAATGSAVVSSSSRARTARRVSNHLFGDIPSSSWNRRVNVRTLMWPHSDNVPRSIGFSRFLSTLSSSGARDVRVGGTSYSMYWAWPPASAGGGRPSALTLAHYEHGTRLLEIGSDGGIEQAGWFLPAGGSTSASYWMSDEIIYSIDFHRGLDILRFTGEG